MNNHNRSQNRTKKKNQRKNSLPKNNENFFETPAQRHSPNDRPEFGLHLGHSSNGF
jgi:hypothetical protein